MLEAQFFQTFQFGGKKIFRNFLDFSIQESDLLELRQVFEEILGKMLDVAVIERNALEIWIRVEEIFGKSFHARVPKVEKLKIRIFRKFVADLENWKN